MEKQKRPPKKSAGAGKNFLVMATATFAAGTFGQIISRRNASELDRFADHLFHHILDLVHFFLRVEKTGGNGIFQQGFPAGFERRDFRRVKRLAVMLFFLQGLAFAHQRLILAAGGGVGHESINALADAAGLELFQDGFAQFVRFGFDFCRHKFGNPKYHASHQKQGAVAVITADSIR
jgi:hypothetical protein